MNEQCLLCATITRVNSERITAATTAVTEVVFVVSGVVVVVVVVEESLSE